MLIIQENIMSKKKIKTRLFLFQLHELPIMIEDTFARYVIHTESMADSSVPDRNTINIQLGNAHCGGICIIL